jgi:hypothetical protein
MSKTDSLSQGAADLSKTESMRHFRQLARIEEQAAGASGVIQQVVVDGHPEKKVVDQLMKGSPQSGQPPDSTNASVEMAHQSGQILTWREAKLKNQVVTPPPLEERLNKVLDPTFDFCPFDSNVSIQFVFTRIDPGPSEAGREEHPDVEEAPPPRDGASVVRRVGRRV